MYHRIAPERHAHFRTAETPDDMRFFAPQAKRQAFHVFAALRGAVAGLDQIIWLRTPYGLFHLARAGRDRAGTLGKAQLIKATLRQSGFDALGQIRRRDGLCLKRAGKGVALQGFGEPVARCLHPGPAPWQLGGQIWHKRAIRPAYEPDQTRFWQNLARSNAFARAAILAQESASASSSAPSPSASSGAAGRSIQPAITRASRIIALASSSDRSNFSKMPGTFTRSPFLISE